MNAPTSDDELSDTPAAGPTGQRVEGVCWVCGDRAECTEYAPPDSERRFYLCDSCLAVQAAEDGESP